MSLARDLETGQPSANVIQPDQISKKEIRAALDYWSEKADGGRPPLAKEIDPVELGSLLPFVTLIEVTRDPVDFFFKLVGEHVSSNLDICKRGMRVTECLTVPDDAQKTALGGFYESVSDGQRPVVMRGTLSYVGKGWRSFESVTMPFVDDKGEVCTLLAVTRYYRTSEHD